MIAQQRPAIAHCDVSAATAPWQSRGVQLKNWGQRVASQVASKLMYLPRRPVLDQFAIFVYHRVAPITASCALPTFNVPPSLFRSQLEGLLEHGFKFLAPSEVLAVDPTSNRCRL